MKNLTEYRQGLMKKREKNQAIIGSVILVLTFFLSALGN